MFKRFKVLSAILSIFVLLLSFIPSIPANAASSLGQKLLVGYWHNFDNGTGIIKLPDVSSKWDVLNISFGETGGDRSTLQFTPCYGTPADFKADVAAVQSKGKKVVLSIGGQNGVVLLPDAASKQNFINSTIALIDQYGFDGIDIDLESGISLNGGDNDFKNSTTPQLVNLISAIKTIQAHYGSSFILSMAPETAYVQGGIIAYANIYGAYLPLIYGLKDILTYIHVQNYNSGGMPGLDSNTYTQGTADFEVAMTDMLLHGFPVAGNQNNLFPALRQDQVMIGIPAAPGAAPSGGYISPTEMKKALDYLIKGIPYGGKYQLATPGGYPGFRGLMTWSINWDAKNSFEFSTNYRAYFDALGGGTVTPPPITNTLQAASLSTSSVNNGSYTLTASVPANNTATSYKFFEGTTQIGTTGSLTPGQSTTVTLTQALSNKPAGTYNYTVQLSNSTGAVTSNTVSVTLPTVTPPSANKLQAASLSASAVNTGGYTLTASVPANNTATSYKFFEGNTQIGSTGTLTAGQAVVTLTQAISNKAPGTYNYTIILSDATGTVTSNIVSVTVPPVAPPTPGVQAWAPYTTYKTGDIVSYNSKNYKCVQGHTSLPGWEPANVAALWQAQ